MELHKQSYQIPYKILVIKIHDIEMCSNFFPFLGKGTTLQNNFTLFEMCLQTFKASGWVTKGLLKSNLLVITTLHLLIIE
jgi:hypothetical protein